MPTRRSFLVAGAAAGASIWLPPSVRAADAATRRKVPLAAEGGFGSGVLSGDPEPRAVTLWTRLDGQEAARLRLRLEVARDEGFSDVVLRRDVPVTALRDHTAKVRVGGLAPDERYFFRFRTRTTTSPVGRTQTAPPADSNREVKVAYFSCQDYSSGHFGVYQQLAKEDPDVVVCLGDYVYDRVYSESGYGGVREDKVGQGEDSVAVTIEDYRRKYRLYRSDPDLQALHRRFPFVAMWDDHEVTDNYEGTLPEGAQGTADDGETADVYDRARILAGWRAFHEHMPALRFGKGFRTYRRLRFGRTLDLFLLDSRTGRDPQPCGGSGFAPCSELERPRKYLGDEQLAWLKDGLASSDAAWKAVGNQQMIMPLDLAEGVPVEVDSWNGYQAERDGLTRHIQQRGIRDVVFLTGDIHTFFAGEVRRDGREGPPVATELVGGSTTSPGTAQTVSQLASQGALPADLVKVLTDQLPVLNPWFDYAETRSHGAAVVRFGAREARATYLASRDLRSRDASAEVRRLAELRIPRGVPRVDVLSRTA